ncbi:MAG TPA: hypothetical protein VGQ83_25585 [Polyangia bacterium]|jgi:hypothetical protein
MSAALDWGRAAGRAIRVVGLGALLLGTTRAGAEPAPVRLVFERGPGAEHCPAADALRAGVAGRLGRDPFRADAPRLVRAVIARTGARLAATVEVRGADGKPVGQRAFRSRNNDCVELAAAVELAIAIAIDPFALSRRGVDTWEEPIIPPVVLAPPPRAAPPAAPGQGASAVAPPAPLDDAAAPTPPRAKTMPVATLTALAWPALELFVEGGATGAFGSTPAPTVGLRALVGLRRERLSLGLEARGELPRDADAGGGSVSATVVAAAVVPCYQRGRVAGCVLLAAGAIRGAGHGLAEARSETTSWLAAGARAAVDIPLTRKVALLVSGDLVAPLQRTLLRVSGAPAWTSPVVCGALGLGVRARFP